MLENILSTLFYYAFIAIIVRILGKREIAQLGVLDLVIFLLIADVCAIGIENGDFSLALAISIIAIIEKLISYLLLKIDSLRKIVDGKEKIVIHDGKIIYENIKKELYSIDDLLSQLRIRGIDDLNKVDIAILETDGSLSISLKGENMLLPVIQDGKINKTNLAIFHQNEEWIYKQNIDIKNVFCAFIINNKLCFMELEKSSKKKKKSKIK